MVSSEKSKMTVGCGPQCAKIMLIVFNALFWLSGAAILGVGIWLRVDPGIVYYQKIVTFGSSNPTMRYMEYAAYIFIGLGAFIFIVGMVGCLGAVRESKFILGLYVVFLVLVVAGEIAAGVLAIKFRDQVETILTKEGVQKLKNETYMKNEEFKSALKFVEKDAKCCGIEGYSDYTQDDVRLSCCVYKEGNFPYSTAEKEKLKNHTKCQEKMDDYMYKKGCKQPVIKFIGKNAMILIGVGLGVACLEVFGFIFAICLCRYIGEED